jgi:hypothetical protein
MNTVSINTVRSRLSQRVAQTLAVLAATLFVSVVAGQSPSPSPTPTWPPPNGSPEKNRVVSTIAQLLKDSVGNTALKKDLSSCASAKDVVQGRLGASVKLPDEVVIVFYEPQGPFTPGSLSYPKNGFYSIFYLPPTTVDPSLSDIEVFRKYFVCCYQPW